MYKNIGQKRIYLQILEQITEKIENKELRTGDRLPPERQWAEELGVSRATVREAVRALEMIGLIQCRQGEGNFISDDFGCALKQPLSIMFWLHDGSINEVHEFRQALEIESAKLAAVHADEEQIEELTRIFEDMQSSDDKNYKAQLDQEFHAQIGKMSGNRLVEDTLISAASLIESLISGLREQIIKKDSEATVIDFQHGQILKAIANHDPYRASTLMTEHMLYIEDFLSELDY